MAPPKLPTAIAADFLVTVTVPRRYRASKAVRSPVFAPELRSMKLTFPSRILADVTDPFARSTFLTWPGLRFDDCGLRGLAH